MAHTDHAPVRGRLVDVRPVDRAPAPRGPVSLFARPLAGGVEAGAEAGAETHKLNITMSPRFPCQQQRNPV